jgi:hypothetical protein
MVYMFERWLGGGYMPNMWVAYTLFTYVFRPLAIFAAARG